MRQAILDTSFILTCIKQKIDFFDEIKFMGIEILIPDIVIGEIKSLSEDTSKKKFHIKENAKIALKLLEKNSDSFKKINLAGKNADKSIIMFAKENPVAIVATLDKELKSKIKNPKLVIRDKKWLEII